MPIYSVQAPDGHTIEIQGPAGATHEQIVAQAQALYKPGSGQQPAQPQGFDPASQASAAVRAASHQVPFLGDAAMSLGAMASDALHGHPQGYGEANAQIHDLLAQDAQRYPVTTGIGSVAGGTLAAAVGGMALKAAGVPAALTTMRGGQTLANGARLALAGAAGGAAQAGGEQLAAGNVADALPAAAGGAAVGAIAAPALGALGRVGLGAARRVLTPLAGKTALALSKVFGESASDMQAAWQTHIDATGRPPSMAELASRKQLGAIRGLAKQSSTVAEALQGNAVDAAAQRSSDMQAGFENGGFMGNPGARSAASPAELGNVRTAQGDADYPASRAAPDFKISTNPDPALGGVSAADHIQGQILPLAGLKTADRVRIGAGLQNGTLSGQDAQILRSGLSESLDRSYSPATAGYLKDFDDITGAPGNEAPNAALETARNNFAANSRRVEGATHGASILGSDSANDFAATVAAKPNANPEFQQGLPLGANDALSNAASTPQKATALAARLATDQGLQDKLTTTFGADTAAALQRMGKAETKAATAVAPFNGAPPPDKDTGDADLAQVGLALASHGLGWKLYHAAKVFAGVEMPEKVQATVSRYLSDPKLARQGINILLKAGADASQLRQAAMAIAADAGIQSGDAVSKTMTPSAVTIESVQPATADDIAAATRQQ